MPGILLLTYCQPTTAGSVMRALPAMLRRPQRMCLTHRMHATLATLPRISCPQRSLLKAISHKCMFTSQPAVNKHCHHATTSRPPVLAPSLAPFCPSPVPTTPGYGNWIDRFPPAMRPYIFLLRVDKPIGTWLLYWPSAWGIGMAAFHLGSPILETVKMLAIFGVGAIVMRGAGCTINDMWDRDFDRQVTRTTMRPIAAGIISRPKAFVYLGAQLTVGLAVLLQLNWYSIFLGAASLPLVALYPAMKRITHWPQVVLGLAFNWGAMLGWSAMAGSCNWAVTTPLYLAGITWTLTYDTIYAHQDKQDDVKVGVKSTALLFGDRSRAILSLSSLNTIGMLCLAGYANDQSWIYYLTTVGAGGSHLAWQLATVDFDRPDDCWRKFISNTWLGALIFGGISLDYFFKDVESVDNDNNPERISS